MSAAFDLERLRGRLIVSCQAEGDDPFNRPENIALMARAAAMGGAAGIRAREPENVAAIRQAVDLPIIGITKSAYPDGSVLITPDFEAVDALVGAGADIVALDATRRDRPNGMSGHVFLTRVKTRCPRPLMADVSTLAEGLDAAGAGADIVAPTLAGYTPYTQEAPDGEPDWRLLERLVKESGARVIMEGRIWTPAQARRALDLGAFAVVVGTAITRPRVVTQAFVEGMRKGR